MAKRSCYLLLLYFCSSATALAQIDSAYYSSYENLLTCRFYFSNKYTSFRFYDRQDDIRLRYLPNTKLNMGVGATYKWATLNLAYGFDFLNPDDGKGDTKYIDLQCHIYGRKFLFDLFGQFYRGFYLDDEDLRDANGDYYTRPDIKVRQFGFSAYYLFNHQRFSYRAGFLQNEWQKKSAGTVLLGWQLVWGNGQADSTIIPSAIMAVPMDLEKRRLTFVEIGPSFGYAYSLVIRKNFFVMASGTMALVFGTNRIESPEKIKSSSFIPNFSLKAFAGYNNEKWAISFTMTNDIVHVSAGSTDQLFTLNTGNVRLNFVRRFRVKRDLLKLHM